MLLVDEFRTSEISRVCTALLAVLLGCSGEEVHRRPVGDTIELKIVAHQDDDLLFMNPDLAESIGTGRTVRTVFLTAGDAGRGAPHWTRREEGILDAYATMASAENSWEPSTLLVAGHQVQLRSLSKIPRVSVVFLRLPDGNGHGGGFPATGKESLGRLWSGKIPAIHPVDGSASYSKSELIALLTGLMKGVEAQTVDTQDWTGRFKNDHSDHFHAAKFAHAAEQTYQGEHTTRVYRGYNLMREPANLLFGQQAAKEKFFLGYARHDGQLCPAGGTCRARSDYPLFLGRQYPFLPGNLIGPGGKCLQLLTGKRGGRRVAMRTCRELPEQKWSMEGAELRSGLGGCLSTQDSDGLTPAALVVRRCSDEPDQGWSMTADGHLKGADDVCATLSAGGKERDPDVYAAGCGNVPEQKWRLYAR